MCGIAGIIQHYPYCLDEIKRRLHHRGPDDQSIYIDNQVALIHTRLSIQDVLNGSQPFHFGPYTIIFNGEIYNHLALRQYLSEFSFTTQSDTETLLYLYIKYKNKLFDLIDGMFAFCIYDREQQVLFLARDKAGKKPLYYITHSRSFIFASEINAIKSILPLSINQDAINCYLRAGFIYKPYTAYDSLFELEAGHYLQVDVNDLTLSKHQFFNLFDQYQLPKLELNLADATQTVESSLTKSVRDRLLASDIEVGAFLSGGIDSNLIVALAAGITPNLKTFTVKFADGYDESHLSRLTAERYGTKHTEIPIHFDVSADIESILRAYGEPFMDSSAIPSYYVSKAARQHVKVILNGDGADELFAGYRRYVPLQSNLFQLARYLSPLKHILPAPKQKLSRYNYIYRLLSLSAKDDLDFYLSATTDIFEDFHPFGENPILSEMHDFVATVFRDRSLSMLSKALYLDYNLLLFCDLLVKMDIATMSHSLEGRSPFLSKYMLELAPTLPDEFKINRLTTKHVLRNLAKKHLPKQLVDQPKRGFEVPLIKWVRQDLRHQIYDSLQAGCYAENYLERDFIQRILDDELTVAEDKRAKMLWTLFCLEVWHRNEKYFLS